MVMIVVMVDGDDSGDVGDGDDNIDGDDDGDSNCSNGGDNEVVVTDQNMK